MAKPRREMIKGFYSRAQSALYLDMNVGTFDCWVSKGQIKTYRNPINGNPIYKISELEAIKNPPLMGETPSEPIEDTVVVPEPEVRDVPMPSGRDEAANEAWRNYCMADKDSDKLKWYGIWMKLKGLDKKVKECDSAQLDELRKAAREVFSVKPSQPMPGGLG